MGSVLSTNLMPALIAPGNLRLRKVWPQQYAVALVSARNLLYASRSIDTLSTQRTTSFHQVVSLIRWPVTPSDLISRIHAPGRVFPKLAEADCNAEFLSLEES